MMLLMRHHLLSFLGLGFGTLLLAGCTTPLSPQSSPTPSGMTSQAETTEFAAIAAAQQSGQPFVCAVQAKDNSVRTEYIVSGQMMKATTIMRLKTSPPPTSGQKTTTSYFLRDASFMYIWSDDKETGVKFPVQSMESMKGRLQESGQQVPELPDFSQEEKQKTANRSRVHRELSSGECYGSRFQIPLSYFVYRYVRTYRSSSKGARNSQTRWNWGVRNESR
jgi:hypothetical protein